MLGSSSSSIAGGTELGVISLDLRDAGTALRVKEAGRAGGGVLVALGGVLPDFGVGVLSSSSLSMIIRSTWFGAYKCYRVSFKS